MINSRKPVCPACGEILTPDAPDKGRNQWQLRCPWGCYSELVPYAKTHKGDTIEVLIESVDQRMS